MSAAFCIVNIIAEAKYVLTEFVGVLKCYFYLDSVSFSFQINRFVESFGIVIQVFDISHDSIWLMISNIFRRITTKIHEMNGKVGIQVCSLMETALYFCG